MRQISLEEVSHISNKITGLASSLIGAAITFVIGVILIKLLWGWTVPDLFPAAVDQGLVAHELSWLATTKLTALAALPVSTGSLLAGRWGRQSI